MTLKSCLDKMRSNSLSTRGCGESRQMESLGELDRLVATVVRVVKTGRTGKGVQASCSRIDTDNLGVFSRAVSAWLSLPAEREIPRFVYLRRAGSQVTVVSWDKTFLNVIRFLSESRVKWTCRLSSC